MNRRHRGLEIGGGHAWWSLLLGVILALSLPAIAAEETTPPNIVLILADDLGYGDLGSYGNRWHETPALDRLAREGMRFTDAYACPNCSPSRSALMTGKSSARTGITFPLLPQVRVEKRNAEHVLQEPPLPPGLPLEEWTLAEALKANGYATAIIGKWHLGRAELLPAEQGFEIVFGIDDAELPGSIRRWFGPDYGIPVADGVPGEYMTDRLTREAEHFLEANHQRPFFLYLPHYAPHSRHVGKPAAEAHFKTKPGRPERATPELAAMISGLDDSVGRILRKLEELGLTKNTLVIFLSDNGGLLETRSNGALRAGKGWLYEGGVRVPMIVKWPGKVAAASVIGTPVIIEDLYPTLVKVARGRMPTSGVDGVSLLPLFSQSGGWPSRAICIHMPHYSDQRGFPGTMIREDDWKLIENFDTGRSELFNLRTDPAEAHDLAGTQAAVAAKLRAQLNSWRKNVGARIMTPSAEIPAARPRSR